MRLVEGIVIDQIGDDYVAVATGDATKLFNGMIKLNKTAAFIVRELMLETNVDAVVNAMLNQYDVTEAEAREEVLHLVEKLNEIGLIVND